MRNPFQYVAVLGGALVSNAIDISGKIGDGLESLLSYIPYVGSNSLFQGSTELLTGLVLQELIFRADNSVKKKQKTIDDNSASALKVDEVVSKTEVKQEGLEAKTKTQWLGVTKKWSWRTAKFATSVVSADLILNSFDFIKGTYYGLGNIVVGTADRIPYLQNIVQSISQFNTDYEGIPARIVAGVIGGGLIIGGYRIRHNMLSDNPNIVSKSRVHYRFIPWFHVDWFFSKFPFKKDYAILKGKGYRFIADCFNETKGKEFFATITVPPPKLHIYQDVYYRALKMFDSTGKLDITNEGSTDPQAEILLSGEGKIAKLVCLAYDFSNLASEDTAVKHTVQQRKYGILEKWYAMPINILRNLGRLLTRKGRVKLMELGDLYDITGNFIPTESIESDGKTGKVNLTLDENFLFRIPTFGAQYYDVRDSEGKPVATLVRDPMKRLISLGIWRDYEMYLYDNRYTTDQFSAFCTLLVDAIHNKRRLRKNLRWDTELTTTQVGEIQRYST